MNFNILHQIIIIFNNFKNYFLIIFIIGIVLSLIYTFLEYILTFKKNTRISKIYFFLKKFFNSLIVIILLTIIFSGSLSLYFSIKKINNIYNEYIKLKELKIVLKNLSEEKRLAKIKILNNVNGNISFDLSLYSQDGQKIYNNTFIISGKEIYFDFITINFDYKFVESGDKFTLSIPYKIFSDMIPYTNGYNLLIKDNKNIPYFLDFVEKQPYSITIENYRKIIKYLLKIISDKNFALKEGIRSYHGSSIHFIPEIGSTYIIRSEATGGIIVEKLNF